MNLTLLQKTNLTPTVKSYTFKPEKPFAFIPGQFVMLKQLGAEQKLARAFSIVAEPLTDTITFLMKHNPLGHVSGFLSEAPLGATIETSPAVGRFITNENDTDRVYIATGTGLAPIMSFIVSEQNSAIKTTTLFGARSEEDLFWTDKLPENSLITLSQPSEAWTGLRGRVTAHIEPLIEKHRAAAWYLCGNPAMVTEVRAQLLEAGIDKAAIHFEIY